MQCSEALKARAIMIHTRLARHSLASGSALGRVALYHIASMSAHLHLPGSGYTSMLHIPQRRAFALPWDESTSMASRYRDDRVSPPNSSSSISCVLSPSLSVYHHQINAPPSSSSPPSRDLQDSSAYSDIHTTNKESMNDRRRSSAL